MSDLMYQDEIRDLVRTAYTQIDAGGGRAVAERLYAPDELAAVPEAAIAWALGVGNPVRHADLSPGEVVLDLGCGAGIDSVLAAAAVGPRGRIIGIDLLEAMCDRARAVADRAGVADRCTFEAAAMEELPLDDGTVDVVISNGVLNLSPRKSRALAEIARVLRPGGHLCLADLTVDTELPPEVLASGATWAGCIAGALSERVLRRKLARAGFVDVALDARVPLSVDDVGRYPLFAPAVLDLIREVVPPGQQRRIAVSLIVRARAPARPGDAASGPAGEQPGQVGRGVAASVTPLTEIAGDTLHGTGVTIRRLKRIEDVDLKVLDVAPGGSTPFHTHAHAHEGVIVSGTGALQLGDHDRPLAPGDVFSVAPGQWHAIAAAGREPLRFVCMDCLLDD